MFAVFAVDIYCIHYLDFDAYISYFFTFVAVFFCCSEYDMCKAEKPCKGRTSQCVNVDEGYQCECGDNFVLDGDRCVKG